MGGMGLKCGSGEKLSVCFYTVRVNSSGIHVELFIYDCYLHFSNNSIPGQDLSYQVLSNF